MPTTAIEILTGVRDLLSDPARWTQGASARDVNGKGCDVFSPEATCFCAIGALVKVAYAGINHQDLKRKAIYGEARDLLYRAEPASLIDINDYEGRHRVLEVYDAAIELASA